MLSPGSWLRICQVGCLACKARAVQSSWCKLHATSIRRACLQAGAGSDRAPRQSSGRPRLAAAVGFGRCRAFESLSVLVWSLSLLAAAVRPTAVVPLRPSRKAFPTSVPGACLCSRRGWMTGPEPESDGGRARGPGCWLRRIAFLFRAPSHKRARIMLVFFFRSALDRADGRQDAGT